MWRLAEPGRPFPARDPHLPNDANARAGHFIAIYELR